jgi:hypothetical protein
MQSAANMNKCNGQDNTAIAYALFIVHQPAEEGNPMNFIGHNF